MLERHSYYFKIAYIASFNINNLCIIIILNNVIKTKIDGDTVIGEVELITFNEEPDIYIGIDAPDFNFFIEKTLKNNKIKVFHYVSPSVWAWRKKRMHLMKNYMHHLFLVFPHEVKIFNSINLPSTYVGHPLASLIPLRPNSLLSKKRIGIRDGSFVISILPGSRSSEVKWHLDVMLSSAEIIQRKIKNVLFVIPCNNKENFDKINTSIRNHSSLNIKPIIGHSHDAINASNIVIVASGTATLETALFKKPMVIIYRTSWLSWQILSRMKIIPWIGLPNILLNKLISPELLQKRANPEEIANEALKIINELSFIELLLNHISKTKEIYQRSYPTRFGHWKEYLCYGRKW